MNQDHEMQHIFNSLSHSDEKLRDKLFQVLAHLEDGERLRVIGTAVAKGYQARDRYPQYRYGRTFFIAIELMKALKEITVTLKKGMESEGTPKAVRLLKAQRQTALKKIARQRKKLTKTEQINEHIVEFSEASEEGFTNEEIAQFAAEKYGIHASHETFRLAIKKFDAEMRSKKVQNDSE